MKNLLSNTSISIFHKHNILCVHLPVPLSGKNNFPTPRRIFSQGKTFITFFCYIEPCFRIPKQYIYICSKIVVDDDDVGTRKIKEKKKYFLYNKHVIQI